MNDFLLEAREELKRLEHIIYVTLKYTRTADVLLNALQRLISVYDLIIEAYLEKAKGEGKISALPKSPALRATTLGNLFPEDKELALYLTFYSFLKFIAKAPHGRREEFRRHVMVIIELDKATAEVDIDTLENYERFAHKFLHYAWGNIVGHREEA